MPFISYKMYVPKKAHKEGRGWCVLLNPFAPQWHICYVCNSVQIRSYAQGSVASYMFNKGQVPNNS